MSEPFFSIVIPVFKTEAFLEQCLKSIQTQIFTNFECILVNDGSLGVDFQDFDKFQDTDFKPSVDVSRVEKSEQLKLIFDSLVAQDSRFKLINKSNGGLSSARNAGLKFATGKWLILVDPDDWVEPDFLRVFAQAITDQKNSKIAIPKFVPQEFYNTKNRLNLYLPKKITLANTIHSCTFFSWTQAYNLAIIKFGNLKFDEKLGRGSKLETRVANDKEDVLFAFEYLNTIEKRFGVDQFEIMDIDPSKYKYRELQMANKKQSEQIDHIKYAIYFQQFGFQNKRINVKIITFLLPLWTKLRFYKNPAAKTLRKIISFLFKLISRCYF